MQIQNLKSDFRDFNFLLFLGIKYESNHMLHAALFLMQIQNLNSDCQDFDLLLFLGIKSECNY